MALRKAKYAGYRNYQKADLLIAVAFYWWTKNKYQILKSKRESHDCMACATKDRLRGSE
jgi:hypothetical protein